MNIEGKMRAYAAARATAASIAKEIHSKATDQNAPIVFFHDADCERCANIARSSPR